MGEATQMETMQDAYRTIRDGMEKVRLGMDLLGRIQFSAIATPEEPENMTAQSALMRLIEKPAYQMLNPSGKYLKILSTAYLQITEEEVFGALCYGVTGSKRRYFGRAADEIIASGTSTNPQQIPGTPYWALMNLSTSEKRKRLAQALHILGYGADEIAKVCETIRERH